ncbi:potassium-transporting ATPase subunit C, partial [Dietzia sp. SLG310A2-38A2]|nr:potassium-transporting ATPase subunit C [Dietzia sp. SLG310A2-38A2]
EGRQLGFLGQPRVRVTELNVALGLTAPGCAEPGQAAPGQGTQGQGTQG